MVEELRSYEAQELEELDGLMHELSATSFCNEELSPNGQVVALNIPAGQWHTVRALESGSVIMEVKDGAYEPLQDCDVLKM